MYYLFAFRSKQYITEKLFRLAYNFLWARCLDKNDFRHNYYQDQEVAFNLRGTKASKRKGPDEWILGYIRNYNPHKSNADGSYLVAEKEGLISAQVSNKNLKFLDFFQLCRQLCRKSTDFRLNEIVWALRPETTRFHKARVVLALQNSLSVKVRFFSNENDNTLERGSISVNVRYLFKD